MKTLFTLSRFSSAVQQVNHPIHNGKPNGKHGKFFIVGSIPLPCYDMQRNGSRFYDTEQAAIDALIAAGASYIQRLDCSRV